MINRDEAYSLWKKITGSTFHPEKLENFMTLAAFGTADSEKQTNEVFSDSGGITAVKKQGNLVPNAKRLVP